ncbi:MAG: hypothetical protein KatS3mg114_0300 [Planctomycetaceae bacterium]|nr:MAG: hypothetical protein KatS3mg114_0300 [Planctomycetaceae bacterium]
MTKIGAAVPQRRTLLCLALAVYGLMVANSRGDDLTALIAPEARVTKLVGDCRFTEGPAYSPQGFLLFSDIPNNRIVRWDLDGKVTDYLKPSGQANGLIFDAAGNLYLCQGGARRIALINAIDGQLEPLCERYDDKLLNSPNDLALDYHGGLYFTDPRYGDASNVEQPVMGVYYIAPHGEVTRVIDTLPRPNGILVTPDGKTLYVANPDRRELWVYPIESPGKLGAGKVLFTGDAQLDGGGPDGMALDEAGRIYASYAQLVVLNPQGGVIGRIPIPEKPANVTFGGAAGKTLFITARTSLYSLAMQVAGVPWAAQGPRPKHRVSTREPLNRQAAPRIVQPVSRRTLRADPHTVKIEDITLQVPATWQQQPPANRLRLAQFQIPATKEDSEAAELVVSFFGGDGGGIDANLKRWNDQFLSTDRKIQLFVGQSPQGKYYLSDISGTYQKPIGPPIANQRENKPGYRALSVILQVADKGNYFLRLIGPEKTVSSAADDFRRSFGADPQSEKPYKLP